MRFCNPRKQVSSRSNITSATEGGKALWKYSSFRLNRTNLMDSGCSSTWSSGIGQWRTTCSRDLLALHSYRSVSFKWNEWRFSGYGRWPVKKSISPYNRGPNRVFAFWAICLLPLVDDDFFQPLASSRLVSSWNMSRTLSGLFFFQTSIVLLV